MSGRANPREAGFALVIVLWTVGLLALLGSHIAASARNAAIASAGLRGAAIAEAAADGVANQAIFHLLDHSSARWAADGERRTVTLPGGQASVVITDDAGRINPSTASGPVLAALLRHVGVPDPAAATLGAAMLDWRTAGIQPSKGGAKDTQYLAAGRPYGPPRERYASLDEMLLVLGMTPEIYEWIAPFLSVHKAGGVNLQKAGPAVVAALTDVAGSGSPILQPVPDGAPIIADIQVVVALSDGTRSIRRAQVEIGSTDDDAARPYRVLAWD